METENELTFHDAVEQHNKIAILQMLETIVEWKSYRKNNDAILHLVLNKEGATESDIIEILQIFIDKKIDLNITNIQGETVLQVAVSKELSNVIDFLLCHGSNINLPDRYGNTVLHLLLKNPKGTESSIIGILQIFLKYEIDMNVKNIYGETALHLAVNNGLKGVIDFLLKNGADINLRNKYGDTVIHILLKNPKIAESNILDILNMLINLGMDPNARNAAEETALHLAVGELFKVITEFLLQHNADINSRDKYENTLLHLVFRKENATEANIIEMLKLLLNLGMDPNANNKSEYTPLDFAIGKQFKNVIDLLLNHGADINIRKQCGDTIAHKLTWKTYEMTTRIRIQDRETFVKKRINFIKWLITKGLNIFCENEIGISPLVQAIKLGFIQIVPTYLEHYSEVNYVDDNKKNLLHLILETNFFEYKRTPQNELAKEYMRSLINFYYKPIIKILLDKGVSVDAVDTSGNTVLHLIERNPDEWFDVTELILNHFSNVKAHNNEGNNVLLIATKMCKCDNELLKAFYTDFVRILVAKGVDINIRNAEDYSPVQYAVRQKHWPVIQILIENGADCSVMHKGKNLFHLFGQSDISTNQDDANAIIERLVSVGCDINGKDDEGMLALHYACQFSNYETIQGFLTNGADVHVKYVSDSCQTLLHVAAERGEQKVIEAFIKAGASLNLQDKFGCTPLHMAVEKGNKADKLLEAGARVDIANHCGVLPLHLVVQTTDVSNISALIKYGANINEHRIIEIISRLGDENVALDVILDHWFKMKWVGLSVLDDYRKFVENETDFQEKQTICQEEVAKLKNHLIDARVSCYNFLHMNLNRRCIYVRNEGVQKFMKWEELTQTFPNYSDLILAAYHQSIMRKDLLEPAMNAWYPLTDVPLPRDCVDMIFDYLDNWDLSTLIDSVNKSLSLNRENYKNSQKDVEVNFYCTTCHECIP